MKMFHGFCLVVMITRASCSQMQVTIYSLKPQLSMLKVDPNGTIDALEAGD
jgi:hypothetical protein